MPQCGHVGYVWEVGYGGPWSDRGLGGERGGEGREEKREVGWEAGGGKE